MANVVRLARGEQFVLSTALTHVPFSEITLDLDTSKHYIQVCYAITSFIDTAAGDC